MNNKSPKALTLAKWAMKSYALIAALALAFNLSTDRSFDAPMLGVIPVSLVAFVCLLVGPWLEGERRADVFKAWLVGASLILAVSVAFALRGGEQAKTGELVFTYAAMIMALPSSIVLPFAIMWTEPLLETEVSIRIIGMWVFCIVLGELEWKAFEWLRAKTR